MVLVTSTTLSHAEPGLVLGLLTTCGDYTILVFSRPINLAITPSVGAMNTGDVQDRVLQLLNHKVITMVKYKSLKKESYKIMPDRLIETRQCISDPSSGN